MNRAVLGLMLAAAMPAAFAQPGVTRSALLDAKLSAPATRAFFDAVPRNTSVDAGNGLIVTLGPQTATVTLNDSHGDDSTGWGSGSRCAKAEVLTWREADAQRAFKRFLNDARRAGWKASADMASSEGGFYRFAKAARTVKSALRAYDRGASSVFVAILCAQ